MDYKVATYHNESLAVIFPSWLTRESAIGRSPLWLDGTPYSFTNWVECGEQRRGHLKHKAWIRLRNWPLLYWNEADVKAAVSGLGELWEVDELSREAANVEYFRLLLRCQDALLIPEKLVLMVEDRCFHIPIEVEDWVDADPILLGEAADLRLGLTTREDQDRFLNTTGFEFIPPAQLAVDQIPAMRCEAGSSGGWKKRGRDVAGRRPPSSVEPLSSRYTIRLDSLHTSTTPVVYSGGTNDPPAGDLRGLPLSCPAASPPGGTCVSFFPPSEQTFPPLETSLAASGEMLEGGPPGGETERSLGQYPPPAPVFSDPAEHLLSLDRGARFGEPLPLGSWYFGPVMFGPVSPFGQPSFGVRSYPA